MYDITNIARRYFSVKLTAEDEDGKEHTTVVEVGPPRLKMLREMMDIAVKATKEAESGETKTVENVIAELRDIIRKMLNKNKSGYKVPNEYVEAMDFDEMIGLLNAFFDWMNQTKQNDPN
ncbi:hypothetical protein [Caproicibacter fermentans]|uniref:Uncharacterized protein n=1 Tax=Caproicibacter fermentans TaxID=2576756 RepID=A0A7G8TDY2_9FIRM|nr:hypothetical protein [Caproicibacter fermentans]QNK41823.1 hypothetical protein HCR03_06155 [Caproicibacter fermentans]